MPHNMLHILGTARPEGTGIARIVAALAKGLDAQRYKIHAWFLAGVGPLTAELQAAGAKVQVVDWPSGGGGETARSSLFDDHRQGRHHRQHAVPVM